MDALDEAIQKSHTKSPSDQVSRPGARFFGGMGVIILSVALVWWAWTSWQNREQVVYYSNISKITPTYTSLLPYAKVYGELSGVITEPYTVSVCDERVCEMRKRRNDHYLVGLQKDVHQVKPNTDGHFSVRLKPGSYYVNVHLDASENASDIPARVDIKAGQKAHIQIRVTKNLNNSL